MQLIIAVIAYIDKYLTYPIYQYKYINSIHKFQRYLHNKY